MHIDQAENNNHLNEALRLEKLNYYEILDTPAEKAFDLVAQLAAAAFHVPDAGICFDTAKQLFFKSRIGSELQPFPEDAYAFFASAEIKSPDGYVLGFIYVADTTLHQPTLKQEDMLILLADMVTEKLESRIAIRRTFRAYDDRLHVLVHDLKNPMTTISLQSELLGRIPGIEERAALIAAKINAQSKRMIDQLNELLNSARKEAHSFKPNKVKVDLNELIRQSALDLDVLIKHKNQSVLINIDTPVEIHGDINKLKVIFTQLIDNAIKFSPSGNQIKISHQVAENEITIAVQDYGVGLTENDLEKIFLKFAPLSAVATGGENTYGLGLVTVKALIDIHKGKLSVESEGKNRGTTFFVALPVK